MKAKKKSPEKELVRVEVNVKRKVQKYLIGKKQSIGDFYTEAADEKLKREAGK